MEMWMIWIIAAILFAIIEIYTPSFFIMWFSVGAISSALSCIFTDNVVIQFGIFIVISTILIFSTKKLSDKMILKSPIFKTNTDTLMGKTGIVIDKIDPINNVGRIQIEGQFWKATTSDKSIIDKDTKVKIVSLSGVTVTVDKAE